MRVWVALLLVACAPVPDLPDGAARRGWWDAAATADAPIAPDAGTDAQIVCAEGTARCEGDLGCDTYLWDDELACGECPKLCDAAELCVAGECAVPTVVQLSLGASFSCARLSDGHVLCWGENVDGQLGDGWSLANGMGVRAEPAAVLDLDDVSTLWSGVGSSCAIHPDGTVDCWGNNSANTFGPLGASRSPRPRPSELLSALPVLQVSPLIRHLCAITATKVLCTGDNFGGALGRIDPSFETTELTAVEVLPDIPPTMVACGGSFGFGHTCVAMSDGAVYCFGDNTLGQCGQPLEMTAVFGAHLVGGLSGIVALGAGRSFTCTLDSAGAVFCFGRNADGELGIGVADIENHPTPTQVIGIPPIRSIAVGSDFVLAVSMNGEEVWGWGNAEEGPLGLGPLVLEPVPTPRRVLFTIGADYVAAAGNDHACVMDQNDGSILCAGGNDFGQLGRPPGPKVPTFEPVVLLP